MGPGLASGTLPRGVLVYRPDAEGWLRAAGYFDGGPAPAAPGRRVVFSTDSRENAIVGEGPRGAPVFEKRTRAITTSDLSKLFRRAGRITSPCLHECAMIAHARDRGVRVPDLVAAGMVRGRFLPRSDFLLTETLAGRSLFEMLPAIVARGGPEARALAAAVGRAVAGLHAAGIAFPDLFAKHVFLERSDGGGWSVGFLDLASAYVREHVPASERARDLGALAASLPLRIGPRLPAAFLEAYLGSAGGGSFREWWRASDANARRYLRLRRFRRYFRGSTGLIGPAGLDPVPVGDAIAGPLKELLLATFGAGLLPAGDLLPHLRRDGGGRLVWDPRAPLRPPRRARAIHARWRILFLRREIARSPLSPEVKRSLIRWLGRDPVAAFALTDL